MTQPLALVLYDRLLPGSQLVNKLQDLRYRVQTVSDPKLLVRLAQEVKPLVVFVDLESGRPDMCEGIAMLRKNTATGHLPVIAIATEASPELHTLTTTAGANLLVSEVAVLAHLPQFLEQALRVE